MNNKKIINGALCLMFCVISSPNQVLAADDGFDASEIKKLRFLSRALIKSRANEKLKIEKEILPERAKVKKIQDTLSALETAQQQGMSVSSTLVGQDDTDVNIVESIADSAGKNVGPQKKTAVATSTANAPVIKSSRKNRQNRLHKKRAGDIDKAISSISTVRAKVKDSMTSKFKFWKEKSKKDKRNEHVIRMANDVESELRDMKLKNKLDMKRVKALKERMKIKKRDIVLEGIDPTFQTRRKHRN